MAYSDDELLNIVRLERQRSIGFGEGDSGELTSARETALAYYKGDMINVSGEHRVPSLPNRSKAVDTALADAVETVLPDVLEIFVDGDDIATFTPLGEQDEEASKEESDFITNAVMVQNEGFLNLYSAFKDALLVRTGILHWWWEDKSKAEIRATLLPQEAQAAPMVQQVAAMGSPAQPPMQLDADEQEDGSVNLTQTKLYGKVCIKAYPPEDFTVARDTVSLRETAYCAVRSRPRVQDLIAQGIDPEKARALPTYYHMNDAVELARDEAGEHNLRMDGGIGDLRVVEVRNHYVRLAGADGQLTVFRVMTNGEETEFIESEEVGQIPFAALTPYIIPHRFYGESVADKLIEIQKIKTVLLRAGLDNIYFGLNQRMEVSDTGANEHTIADLLRNEPGVPVRSKTGEAVRPISAGPLNVDTWQAMEMVSVMGESRSGIVRNAQGLNPDTLHDTAKGAIALMSMAQRRTRFIARIFAETGLKDLFLGVHAMYRQQFTAEHAPPSAKVRKKWMTVQPDTWAEREAVSIGIGSSGKDHEFMVATQRLDLMEKTVQLQGGLHGPILTPGDVYAAVEDWERAAGTKNGDQYWTDPSAPPDPNNPPPQPPPNPELMKVQGQQQLDQQKAQGQQQLAEQQMQATTALEAKKAELKAQSDETAAARDFSLQQQRIEGELALKREESAQKLQLERERAAADLDLQRQEMLATVALKREELRMKTTQSTDVDDAVEELPG